MAAGAARVTDRFAALAERLLASAEAIAAAKITELQLARTDPAARWRKAALLWPRFTQGQ